MNTYSFSDPGVVTGVENNNNPFIRKTIFQKGYSENTFHNHPNSYEFYIVLTGQLTFENESHQISVAKSGTIIYFGEAELHKITSVEDDVEILLIKKLGSTKE